MWTFLSGSGSEQGMFLCLVGWALYASSINVVGTSLPYFTNCNLLSFSCLYTEINLWMNLTLSEPWILKCFATSFRGSDTVYAMLWLWNLFFKNISLDSSLLKMLNKGFLQTVAWICFVSFQNACPHDSFFSVTPLLMHQLGESSFSQRDVCYHECWTLQ